MMILIDCVCNGFLKFVQKLEAHSMFLPAISETSVGLSLSIYRWKTLPEQNVNITLYLNFCLGRAFQQYTDNDNPTFIVDMMSENNKGCL